MCSTACRTQDAGRVLVWMLCAPVPSCPAQAANEFDLEFDFDADADPDTYLDRQREAVVRAVAKLPHLQDLAVRDDIGGTHIGRLAHASALTRLEVVYYGG